MKREGGEQGREREDLPCPRKWTEGGAESGRKAVKGGVGFQQREILTLTLATREKKQLSQHSLTWRSENQDRQTGRQTEWTLSSISSLGRSRCVASLPGSTLCRSADRGLPRRPSTPGRSRHRRGDSLRSIRPPARRGANFHTGEVAGWLLQPRLKSQKALEFSTSFYRACSQEDFSYEHAQKKEKNVPRPGIDSHGGH